MRVAISEGIALVGAAGNDDNGTGSGSAYVFDVATGQELFKLLADDGTSNDFFGAAVGIAGSVVIVGAYGADGKEQFSGAAYLFDVTTGQQPGSVRKRSVSDEPRP